MHHRLIAMLASGLALAVPAAAEAATRTVSMGVPSQNARDFQRYSADANRFFPTRTVIRAGDRVRFVPAGFHNVDLPRRGGRGTPLFSPFAAVSGVNDAAGAPFWFNGQPQLGFTPSLLQSNFGKTITHTGARSQNSGLPLGPARPMTVRFPRPGSYGFLCDVHPDMRGRVVVRSRRGSIPSARAHRRAAVRELAAARRTARQLSRRQAPANTVMLGVARSGVDVLAFVPQRLTVPVGTTVDFRMDAGSREVHTATFGPGDAQQGTGYVGEIAKTFEAPQVDPRGTYPSEAPGGVATLTPGLHGNGFWNSGILGPPGKIPNVPASNRVTFGQAGTYPYVCLIHPFMKGEVVVT